MKYIPDKQLYKAVMFALEMCGHSLQYARDKKIKVAANYYGVDENDVFRYVKDELWQLERKQAQKDKSRWHTVFNPHGLKLLGFGFAKDYVFICPQCGYSCATNVHDDFGIDRLFLAACPACGFTDKWQRQYTRKSLFERLKQRGESL